MVQKVNEQHYVLDKILTGREKSVFAGVFFFLYTWLITNKQHQILPLASI